MYDNQNKLISLQFPEQVIDTVNLWPLAAMIRNMLLATEGRESKATETNSCACCAQGHK
jgi:hypothetical protein